MSSSPRKPPPHSMTTEIPTIQTPSPATPPQLPSHAPSSSDPPKPTQNLTAPSDPRRKSTLSSSLAERPGLGNRKSSGTIIIPRDSPNVEVKDEQYDEGDARAMSPRRSSDEIERMGDEARGALEEQARTLQASLLEIVNDVETVKSEHEKLEGGNKFLQSYIGELMQTSKITASGSGGKSKQKGKSSKTK